LQKDLAEVYTYLDIPAKPLVNNSTWAYPLSGVSSVSLVPQAMIKGRMPDVTGMGLKDAVYLLEENGMKVMVNGKGSIVRQSVPAGNIYAPGTIVILDLASRK